MTATASMSEDPEIARAIAEYMKAEDEGRTPSPETWLENFPAELRPKLRDFLDDQAMMVSTPPIVRQTMPDMLPDAGRYTGFVKVGEGGMGAVYEALDGVLGRQVAIKVVRDDYQGDRSQFASEARVVAGLEHSNIVPIFDHGVLDNVERRPFFSMMLVRDGRHFGAEADRVRASGDPARLDELLRQFISVCEALHYAHGRTVLHRDLKPGNVMIGGYGVLVMDWGLSRVGAAGLPAGSVRLDETNAIRGTFGYMPPEQARGQRLNERADVFALGGLLLYALTGRAIYVLAEGTSAYDMARDGRTEGALARLGACGADPELCAVARKCLAADADGRYASAGEVGAAVRAVFDGRERRAREAEMATAKLEAGIIADRKRRRVWGVVVGLLIALGIGAAGSIWWYRNDQAKRTAEELVRTETEETRQLTRDAEIGESLKKMYQAVGGHDLPAARIHFAKAKSRLGGEESREVDLAESHLGTATSLDLTRQELAVRRMDPKLSDTPAIDEYSGILRSAGIDLDASDVANRIRTSPIRPAIIAALEDLTPRPVHVYDKLGIRLGSRLNNPEFEARLLNLIKETTPQSQFSSLLHDLKTRSDPQALENLAATLRLDSTPVVEVQTLLEMLPRGPKSASLIKRSALAFPHDFWIQMTAARRAAQFPAESNEDFNRCQEEAIGYARAALAIRPDSAGAMKLLGDLMFKTNQVEELEQLAISASASKEKGWMVASLRADAALKRSDASEALRIWKQELERRPSDEIRLNYAFTLTLNGKLEEAMAIADELLLRSKDSTDRAGAFHIKVFCELVARRFGEASLCAIRALKESPRDPEMIAHLAMILASQGRTTQAEQIIRSMPRRFEIEFSQSLGGILTAIPYGDPERLLHMCNRVRKGGQEPGEPYFRLFALCELGKIRLALELSRELQRQDYLLGKTSLTNGFIVKAELFVRSLHLTNMQPLHKKTRPFPDPDGHTDKAFWIDLGGDDSRLGIAKFAAFLLIADYSFTQSHYLYSVEFYHRAFEAWSRVTPEANAISMGCSNRMNALRAAGNALMGKGVDAFRAKPEQLDLYRGRALRWLSDELSSINSDLKRPAQFAKCAIKIEILKHDLALHSIRSEEWIGRMPEADQKLFKAQWVEVDRIWNELNPPLDLPAETLTAFPALAPLAKVPPKK